MRRFTVVLFALVLVCLVAAPAIAAKPNLGFTTHITLDGDKLGKTPASGFVVKLDGVVGLHELGVTGTKTNPGLVPDDYEFYLDAGQAQQDVLTAYFAAKATSNPGGFWDDATIQAAIGSEIDGTNPFFYLTYDGETYFLADGFVNLLGGGMGTPLRIDGDYPEGTYAYDGTLVGTNDATLDLTIELTVEHTG